MKKIVCELCGSNDLKKKDGEYECQYCGTKYSIEEAKKLIVEGKVKIDKSDDIANYIEMANNALNSNNTKEAYEFANKALEINPKSFDAWVCKMKSCSCLSTESDLKIEDLLSAAKNVIYCNKDKKEAERIVYSYYLLRMMELLKCIQNKYSNHAELNNAFDKYYKDYYGTAKENTAKFDYNNMELYEKQTSQAIDLLNHIPREFFVENPDQALQLIECAKQYKYMCDAWKTRYLIYKDKIPKSDEERRNVVISAMYSCAIDALTASNPSFDVNSIEVVKFEASISNWLLVKWIIIIVILGLPIISLILGFIVEMING